MGRAKVGSVADCQYARFLTVTFFIAFHRRRFPFSFFICMDWIVIRWRRIVIRLERIVFRLVWIVIRLVWIVIRLVRSGVRLV